MLFPLEVYCQRKSWGPRLCPGSTIPGVEKCCVLGPGFSGETLQMLAYLGEATHEALSHENRMDRFTCSAKSREARKGAVGCLA